VRATESNSASLKVLEEFVNGLGDDGWAAVPHMKSKRIAMVDLAVDRFKKLHADNPDDLVIKVRLVGILVRSANLYRMVGKNDKAGERFSEGAKLLEALKANAQLNETDLGAMGDFLFSYANFIEEQQGASGAIAICLEEVEICRKRLLLSTDATMAKFALSIALAQLAGLQNEAALFDEARKNAKAGQEVLHELSKSPLGKLFYYDLFDIVAFEQQAKRSCNKAWMLMLKSCSQREKRPAHWHWLASQATTTLRTIQSRSNAGSRN